MAILGNEGQPAQATPIEQFEVSEANILLVEDTAAHVELIRRSLLKTPFTLLIENSLEGARARLKGPDSIDLLIVDLMLPDGRGTELLADRKIGYHKPVIILTSQGDEQSAVNALKQGALDYIPKSASSMGNMAAIVNRVFRDWQHILARREAEAALHTLNAELENRVKQRSAELAKAYEKIKELERLKSKFIDDISHELRTPVTNINLYLDLLASGKPQKRDKYQAILREQSERLTSLFDGILEFSKMQKSLGRTKWKLIELNGIIENVVATFAQLAKIRELELTFLPWKEELEIWGEPLQIEEVLCQLLQNALTYTPTGYVHLALRPAQEEAIFQLTIEDSGMGMDEEELAHCFDRFYRGKRVGQLNIATGPGLGLATVRDIVRLHRGWVEVESELDKGTIFSVYIPINK